MWQGYVLSVCCPPVVPEQRLGEEKGRRALRAHSRERGALAGGFLSSAFKPFKTPENSLIYLGQELCACGALFCVGKRARGARGRAGAAPAVPGPGAGRVAAAEAIQALPRQLVPSGPVAGEPQPWGRFSPGLGAYGVAEGPVLQRGLPCRRLQAAHGGVSVPFLSDKMARLPVASGPLCGVIDGLLGICSTSAVPSVGALQSAGLSLVCLWLALCLCQLVRPLLRAPREEPGRGLMAATSDRATRAVSPSAAGEPLPRENGAPRCVWLGRQAAVQ